MSRPSTYDPIAGLLIAFAVSLGLSYRETADIAATMRWQPQISKWKRDHPDFAGLCKLAESARTNPIVREVLWDQIKRIAPSVREIVADVAAFAGEKGARHG